MIAVLTVAAGGRAHALSVGGPVASAGETIPLDNGLQPFQAWPYLACQSLTVRRPTCPNRYSVKDALWLGSEAVAEGSNEIPAVQELLRRTEIEGSLITADAVNTQTETARIIVQERGADYLFTVKGNQKGVADNVQQLYRGLSHAFSP